MKSCINLPVSSTLSSSAWPSRPSSIASNDRSTHRVHISPRRYIFLGLCHQSQLYIMITARASEVCPPNDIPSGTRNYVNAIRSRGERNALMLRTCKTEVDCRLSLFRYDCCLCGLSAGEIASSGSEESGSRSARMEEVRLQRMSEASVLKEVVS